MNFGIFLIPYINKTQGYYWLEPGIDQACGAQDEETRLPDPSTLTSIKTFQPELTVGENTTEEELKTKRKHDNEDDDFDAPKVSIVSIPKSYLSY